MRAPLPWDDDPRPKAPVYAARSAVRIGALTAYRNRNTKSALSVGEVLAGLYRHRGEFGLRDEFSPVQNREQWLEHKNEIAAHVTFHPFNFLVAVGLLERKRRRIPATYAYAQRLLDATLEQAQRILNIPELGDFNIPSDKIAAIKLQIDSILEKPAPSLARIIWRGGKPDPEARTPTLSPSAEDIIRLMPAPPVPTWIVVQYVPGTRSEALQIRMFTREAGETQSMFMNKLRLKKIYPWWVHPILGKLTDLPSEIFYLQLMTDPRSPGIVMLWPIREGSTDKIKRLDPSNPFSFSKWFPEQLERWIIDRGFAGISLNLVSDNYGLFLWHGFRGPVNGIMTKLFSGPQAPPEDQKVGPAMRMSGKGLTREQHDAVNDAIREIFTDPIKENRPRLLAFDSAEYLKLDPTGQLRDYPEPVKIYIFDGLLKRISELSTVRGIEEPPVDLITHPGRIRGKLYIDAKVLPVLLSLTKEDLSKWSLHELWHIKNPTEYDEAVIDARFPAPLKELARAALQSEELRELSSEAFANIGDDTRPNVEDPPQIVNPGAGETARVGSSNSLKGLLRQWELNRRGFKIGGLTAYRPQYGYVAPLSVGELLAKVYLGQIQLVTTKQLISMPLYNNGVTYISITSSMFNVLVDLGFLVRKSIKPAIYAPTDRLIHATPKQIQDVLNIFELMHFKIPEDKLDDVKRQIDEIFRASPAAATAPGGLAMRLSGKGLTEEQHQVVNDAIREYFTDSEKSDRARLLGWLDEEYRALDPEGILKENWVKIYVFDGLIERISVLALERVIDPPTDLITHPGRIRGQLYIDAKDLPVLLSQDTPWRTQWARHELLGHIQHPNADEEEVQALYPLPRGLVARPANPRAVHTAQSRAGKLPAGSISGRTAEIFRILREQKEPITILELTPLLQKVPGYEGVDLKIVRNTIVLMRINHLNLTTIRTRGANTAIYWIMKVLGYSEKTARTVGFAGLLFVEIPALLAAATFFATPFVAAGLIVFAAFHFVAEHHVAVNEGRAPPSLHQIITQSIFFIPYLMLPFLNLSFHSIYLDAILAGAALPHLGYDLWALFWKRGELEKNNVRTEEDRVAGAIVDGMVRLSGRRDANFDSVRLAASLNEILAGLNLSQQMDGIGGVMGEKDTDANAMNHLDESKLKSVLHQKLTVAFGKRLTREEIARLSTQMLYHGFETEDLATALQGDGVTAERPLIGNVIDPSENPVAFAAKILRLYASQNTNKDQRPAFLFIVNAIKNNEKDEILDIARELGLNADVKDDAKSFQSSPDRGSDLKLAELDIALSEWIQSVQSQGLRFTSYRMIIPKSLMSDLSGLSGLPEGSVLRQAAIILIDSVLRATPAMKIRDLEQIREAANLVAEQA